MVAFSRRGRKGRREEVEKHLCPSVSAEGSFRVFSGKTAKGNPVWERRSADGRGKAPPCRRSVGARAVDRMGEACRTAGRQDHLPRSPSVVGLSFFLRTPPRCPAHRGVLWCARQAAGMRKRRSCRVVTCKGGGPVPSSRPSFQSSSFPLLLTH